jgi:hypothetical protein
MGAKDETRNPVSAQDHRSAYLGEERSKNKCRSTMRGARGNSAREIWIVGYVRFANYIHTLLDPLTLKK